MNGSFLYQTSYKHDVNKENGNEKKTSMLRKYLYRKTMSSAGILLSSGLSTLMV